MSEELKPCPFCGEQNELYPCVIGFGEGKPYAIDCIGCGMDFVPREGRDVIAAWNTRTPQWQDIATAPKDGEPVLLYKPNERMVGEYTIVGYWGEWPGGGDCWIASGGTPLGYRSQVAGADQGYPTHWMLLPLAPSQD